MLGGCWGSEDLTGSAICLAPPWVISSGICFATGKPFMSGAAPSLFSILPERTGSLSMSLVCRSTEWGGGVGGIVLELITFSNLEPLPFSLPSFDSLLPLLRLVVEGTGGLYILG